jgi:hypothetical protein
MLVSQTAVVSELNYVVSLLLNPSVSQHLIQIGEPS